MLLKAQFVLIKFQVKIRLIRLIILLLENQKVGATGLIKPPLVIRRLAYLGFGMSMPYVC